MKAYDLLVQAESGLAAITGHPAGPGRVGVSVCDIACGMSAHAAILEALLGRAVTGVGRGLEVSLFDAVADWMTVPLLYFEGTGITPPRVGLAHPTICPYGAFPLRDDDLVLISIQNEREWSAFCAHFLQAPELPAQPGYRSNTERVANRAMVDERIAGVFAALNRSEAAARLRACGTAFGFVNALQDLARHPALRRLVVDTPGGPATLVAPPARHSSGGPQPGAVPAVGAHDRQLRTEFSGTP
jgi:crotonobetainyl-CoA:carnitine CoA-transferase CaiB-like acyl-CoA transferase